MASIRLLSLALGASLLASPAFAQGLLTEKRLSSTLASEAVATAVAACAEQGYRVTAVLLDMGGQRQAMLRGDGASLHTLDGAYMKAYASVTYREDTGVLQGRLKDGQMNGFQMKLPNMAVQDGAASIKVDNVAIGALGVSGAPGGDKDTACAKAGIAKIADRMK